MKEEILDAEPLAAKGIKGSFSKMILYVCLLVYPVELFMGYRSLTVDYSTHSGDLVFSPAHGPIPSLFVILMVPLGILTSLWCYIGLGKDKMSSKTIFLLISPAVQFFIYLSLLFPFWKIL